MSRYGQTYSLGNGRVSQPPVDLERIIVSPSANASSATEFRLPRSWLEPLPLPGGPVLPQRILPAPMEGVTEGHFCRVMTRRGLVPCWITPFVRVSNECPRPSRLHRRIEPWLDLGLPVVVQLMGRRLEVLAEAARRIAALGVAGIDLNCACPSATAVRHESGGALLRHPEWIRAALGELRAAAPACGVSIKLRAGFVEAAELTAILTAVRAGRPDFVVLHVRTVQEEYRPLPAEIALRRLTRARELLPDIPLIACGDLRSLDDCARVAETVAVDGVAVGRGLVAQPTLLRRIACACAPRPIPPPWDLAEKCAFLLEIVAEARSAGAYRPGFVLELARYLFGEDAALFRRLAVCRTLEAVQDALAAYRSAAGGAAESAGV